MDTITTKIFSVFIFFRTLFCGCFFDINEGSFEKNQNTYKVNKTGKLPATLRESSGLAKNEDEENFWTHQDSGGSASLYLIDSKGYVIDTLQVPQVVNVDWEDIATDNKDHLFIGDFGNNLNTRQDLKVYKLNLKSNQIETISFKYADQTAFPPAKKSRNFDGESLIWHQDQLHIFSKNRGNKCVKHYVLPDQPGNYEATVVEEKYLRGMITAADIDTNTGLLALMSYGKVYLFQVNNDGFLFSQPYKCIKFPRSGQSEGLSFYGNGNMLISNESGKLYQIKRKQ